MLRGSSTKHLEPISHMLFNVIHGSSRERCENDNWEYTWCVYLPVLWPKRVVLRS